MVTLTLDTETTGIPPRGASWETDFALFPHVASIAWQVHKDGEFLYEQYNYIKPDGWEMPPEAGKVNGLTTEFLMQNGYRDMNVFRHLMTDLLHTDRIIGHNLYFDLSIIKANLLKLDVEKDLFNGSFEKDKRYCTKDKATGIISNKWPKLTEIYKHFFNEDFPAHNALDDVKATYRVYEELIKLDK